MQLAEANLLAITQSQRIFSVVMEEKIFGQINNEAVYLSKIKGGAQGLVAELQKVSPLISSILKIIRVGGKSASAKSVTTVLARAVPSRILTPNEEWVDGPQPVRGPRSLTVHVNAQGRHGLASKAKSFLQAFFARENPWKAGSGAVEGEVSVKGGAIQRGWACRYCLRDGRNLQHWGCVACFLDLESRKTLGILVLLNTNAANLIRQHSEAAKAASAREGQIWV